MICILYTCIQKFYKGIFKLIVPLVNNNSKMPVHLFLFSRTFNLDRKCSFKTPNIYSKEHLHVLVLLILDLCIHSIKALTRSQQVIEDHNTYICK